MRKKIELHIGMREFGHWLFRLFRQPIFIFVTIWGHSTILAGAAAFRHFEAGWNPRVDTFFSAYYWAFATAMTVGSSDIAPVTTGGRVAAILLMTSGCLFVWSYAALFAASVVIPTVRHLDKEMKELEADVLEVEREVRLDKATVEKLVRELEVLNQSRKGKA